MLCLIIWRWKNRTKWDMALICVIAADAIIYMLVRGSIG